MSPPETNWVTSLLANAWPIVTLIGVFALRGPVHGLLQAMARGMNGGGSLKLGFAGVNIELAMARTEARAVLARFTEPTVVSEPTFFVSSGRKFVEAAIQGDAVEAATIDLKSGRGEGFVTSRLFLAAALMSRQRELKVVAFVCDSYVRQGEYVGACLVEDLLRALRTSYPEYEAALDLAIHEQWWRTAAPGVVLSPGHWTGPSNPLPRLAAAGRFPEDAAARILSAALQSLQSALPPLPNEPGWVKLPSSAVSERGEWVTPAWLREALGGALMQERVTKGPDAADQAATCKNPYVGLVDDGGRLVDLISRTRLLDQANRQ